MNYIQYFISLLVVISFACKNHESSSNDNKFVKTWEAIKRPMPFRATLSIKEDSTFYYKQYADLNTGYSNGYWSIDSPYIILTSYVPDSCLYIKEYGKDWHSASEDTKEITSRTTHVDCIPESPVKYVVFDRDSFYIRNDSLFHSSEPNNFFPFYVNVFK